MRPKAPASSAWIAVGTGEDEAFTAALMATSTTRASGVATIASTWVLLASWMLLSADAYGRAGAGETG
jgi:hypothetical protein